MFSTNRDDYELGVFTAREMRWLIKVSQKVKGDLAQVLGDPNWRNYLEVSPPALFIPESTLKRWRKGIGITPDSFNRYTREDLNLLIGLVDWLAKGGTIEAYDKYLTEVFKNGEQTASAS